MIKNKVLICTGSRTGGSFFFDHRVFDKFNRIHMTLKPQTEINEIVRLLNSDECIVVKIEHDHLLYDTVYADRYLKYFENIICIERDFIDKILSLNIMLFTQICNYNADTKTYVMTPEFKEYDFSKKKINWTFSDDFIIERFKAYNIWKDWSEKKKKYFDNFHVFNYVNDLSIYNDWLIKTFNPEYNIEECQRTEKLKSDHYNSLNYDVEEKREHIKSLIMGIDNP